MERELFVLADASVRSLIVAVVAALAAWRRPAAFKHAVWSAVLVSMLLMPAMTTLLPELPIAVWPAPAAVTVPPAVPATALPGGNLGPGAPGTEPWWPEALLMAYVAVAAFFAARLAVAYIMAVRLVRGSTQVLDFRALQFADGREVYESDAARVPVTVGAHIVLPREWRDWDDSCIAAALAHEAAHVRRRDWWMAVVCGVNRCIFWFHPLAWWLERRLSDLAEQAADDSSLIATGDRRAYARLLVQMAQAVHGGRRMAWESLAMARPSGVSRRVEAALDEKRKLSAGMGRMATTAVLGCAAILGIVAGTARLVAQQPEPGQQARPVRPMVVAVNERLTPERAAQLEAQVASNPDDFTARESLIRHYSSAADRDAWKRSVISYIERWPESPRFAEPFFRAIGERMNLSNSDKAELRSTWERMVQQRPNDPRVAVNAARSMKDAGDFSSAATLIERARQSDPGNMSVAMELAEVYASAIVSNDALATHAKQQLEASTDPNLVGLSAMQLRMRVGPDPNHPLAPFLAQMQERARQLSPGMVVREGSGSAAASFAGAVPGGIARGVTGGVAGGVPGGVGPGASVGVAGGVQSGGPVIPAPPPTEGVQRIRVGGNVQAAKLEKQVAPDYPPLAKQARIQGVVKFQVLLAPDGSVMNMTVMSGHPLLIPAAQDALRQWKYSTTLLNGEPVEVLTTVDVNFTLSEQQ